MVIYSGFSYKMVSFYSFLYVYQRVTMKHWDLNGIVGFCPSTGDFATVAMDSWSVLKRQIIHRWASFHRFFWDLAIRNQDLTKQFVRAVESIRGCVVNWWHVGFMVGRWDEFENKLTPIKFKVEPPKTPVSQMSFLLFKLKFPGGVYLAYLGLVCMAQGELLPFQVPLMKYRSIWETQNHNLPFGMVRILPFKMVLLG